MKEQCVIRTYPTSYTNPTKELSEALSKGWIVVSSNSFDCGQHKGTEYILERNKFINKEE